MTITKRRAGAPMAVPRTAMLICLLPVSARAAVPVSENTFTFTDSGVTAANNTAAMRSRRRALTVTESGTYAVTGQLRRRQRHREEGRHRCHAGAEGALRHQHLHCAHQLRQIQRGHHYIQGTVTLTDAEDIGDEALGQLCRRPP